MPVVDGRVQQVDAAANGRDHSVTIRYVGGVVGVTQVGSEAKARDLQAVELSIKSTAARSGSPGSEARRSFRRGKGMIHPTIVAERAARPGETYSGSHFKPFGAGLALPALTSMT
jgi:hypothetical protein